MLVLLLLQWFCCEANDKGNWPLKKLVYLGSIACIAILATSVFAESSSAGESSLDLR